MHAKGLLTIFQKCLHMYYSWKIVRKQFASMFIFQSMWKGPNHCWNFMESGSKSATYAQICSFSLLS